MIKITTHTIVKNEEKWIWYSLMSVKDLVHRMLVFDDNSTDQTAKIIKSIDDPKINLTVGSFKVASEIRNKQLKETKTDWFLILDGDEVWNRKTFSNLLQFLENCPKEVWGVVVKTRNCVGDIYHYQTESAGRYNLLGKVGNYNIRAYRKLPNLRWQWDYPRETYGDLQNVPINDQQEHLILFDNHYWHMTFLPRTSVQSTRKYRQITKFETGIKIRNTSELPEVFFQKRPSFVPDPSIKRSAFYEMTAVLLTSLKMLKRRIK